jgi:hypothetical protein
MTRSLPAWRIDAASRWRSSLKRYSLIGRRRPLSAALDVVLLIPAQKSAAYSMNDQ